jgi:serine phosphatase RsbU (regulator of sigma subunit)
MSEARLHVNDSQGRRVVVLDRPQFLIGRRTAADLQIVSTDVSREHAEIVQEDGRFLLRDRGSRYGTFVNGEQVTERVLEHGDRIRLGRTDAIELVFATDGAKTTGFLDASSDATNLRQMAAILNGLRAVGSGRVLDEVLTLVMDSALDVTKAERGFMMLANTDGELEFKIARGRGKTTLSGTSFTTSEKIPREVFRTGQSLTVGDLMEGDLAGQHDRTIAVGIRHVLCVPLLVNPMSASGAGAAQKTIGVLYLDGREKSTMLSDATRASLEAFATQAALAIDSARLYAESAEKARTDRDLRIAAEIQRALLPEPSFETASVDLAAASIPCRTVGGDFFDYIDIGDRGLGFGLGDVAGKGPPAALLAAAVQSNFAAHAPVSANPAEAMARVNKALLRRAIEARFATMFYGAVTPDGQLSYCNAGQEPPLVVRADGMSWLEEGGPVLGLLSIATYAFETIPLQKGDLIVVCSDGVTEARNQAGDEFGRDRLVAAVRGRHGSKPDVVLEHLLEEVRQFAHGAAQADDITALILRYRGRAQ